MTSLNGHLKNLSDSGLISSLLLLLDQIQNSGVNLTSNFVPINSRASGQFCSKTGLDLHLTLLRPEKRLNFCDRIPIFNDFSMNLMLFIKVLKTTLRKSLRFSSSSTLGFGVNTPSDRSILSPPSPTYLKLNKLTTFNSTITKFAYLRSRILTCTVLVR